MKVMGSVTHYGVGALLAGALAVVLGSIPLFQNAALGPSKLTAANLVQFVCYAGALIMLWMMGHRVSLQMPKAGKWVACLRPIVRPLVTLIVVMSAYVVIPLIAGPVLDESARAAYNWVFIVGTVCAAMWLMMAWVLQSGGGPHLPLPDLRSATRPVPQPNSTSARDCPNDACRIRSSITGSS